MSDSTENNDQTTPEQLESETQRLHRLVLPMILDLLRQRNRRNRRPSSRTRSRVPTESLDAPPPLVDPEHDDDHARDMSLDPNPLRPHTPPDNASENQVDEANEHNSTINNETDTNDNDQPMQDAEDTSTNTSPSTSPNSSRRPRYRLVVYFEERDLPASTNEESSNTNATDEAAASNEGAEHSDIPSAQRSSRYVAIFSVDSDDQNMPIIHSAGLQNTYANFDDILNQLFNSYVPKGTPPAKKEVIDTLPTCSFSASVESHACQPRCAVCLEDFVEGTEFVELPCTHRFHGETCVKHWLRMHNSCPVCRYEMPVDDVEYEKTRQERMLSRNPATTEVDNFPPAGPSAM